MNRIIYAAAFLTFAALSTNLKGQEKWSLKECIDYAIENNIQVKQGELTTQYQENQLKKAKADRLPSLSASMTQGFNYGRSLSFDNTYQNINSAQSDFYAGTDLPLIYGQQITHNIESKKLNLKASLEDLAEAKNSITVNIAGAYLEILFSQELVKVAQEQIVITQQQIDQTNEKVKAGSLAKGALLDIEAQKAREELTLIDYQNQLQLNYLRLAQLLELESYKDFDIEKPILPEVEAQVSLISANEVYVNALQLRPEIKSAGYRLKASEHDLAAIRGAAYPTLSFYANYYNLYNDKYKDLNGDKISFNDQLKNNERKGFGFRLNIPVFNRLENKTQISNSQIEVLNREYELAKTKKILREEIETAQTVALASLNRYSANGTAVTAMEEAFRYSEEKYNVGLVNAVEYNKAKTDLAKAKSDLLQAKYEFIFRTKILDFYRGINIQL